jgi:hypothetical protein
VAAAVAAVVVADEAARVVVAAATTVIDQSDAGVIANDRRSHPEIGGFRFRRPPVRFVVRKAVLENERTVTARPVA